MLTKVDIWELDPLKLGKNLLKFHGLNKECYSYIAMLKKIRKKQKLFLKNCSINRDKVVFLDIPLFNESLHRKTHDYIISMYVNKNIQKKRILRRKNMNQRKMSFILKKQKKLKKVFYSKFVTRINSGIGKNYVRKSFISFIKKVKQKKIKKIWPMQYNLNEK